MAKKATKKAPKKAEKKSVKKGAKKAGKAPQKTAKRPSPNARNVIRNNVLEGYSINRWCVTAAPGVSLRQQTVEGNRCKGR